jgi:hypothetical protein
MVNLPNRIAITPVHEPNKLYDNTIVVLAALSVVGLLIALSIGAPSVALDSNNFSSSVAYP